MMENTELPLAKWFGAIWLVTNHKKGIQFLPTWKRLGNRAKGSLVLYCIGLGQMVIDKAPELLDNVVAIDESHVGGKFGNMQKTKKEANGI